MYERGIRYIRDILCTNGKLKSKQEIENCTGKQINFLFYEGLKRSVAEFIKNSGFESVKTTTSNGPFLSCYLNSVVFTQKHNKQVYETFISNTEKPTSETKWNGIFSNINWKYVHSFVFKISRDTYIQWLHTRIIHRILGTKSLLYKMKIVDDNICTFCNNHEETLTHLFWSCEHIQTIVQYVTNVLNINNVNLTTLSCQDMLLGICIEKMNPINILLLEIKRYIFMCKRTNTIPNVPGLKRTLLLSWEIQKQTTRQNNIFPNWSVVRIFVE